MAYTNSPVADPSICREIEFANPAGTLPEQEVVIAPLARIGVAAAAVEPPGLVVVGELVDLAERLAASPLPLLARAVGY